MIWLPRAVRSAYMRGGLTGWGRCSTCGAQARYAFCTARPAVLPWWPFPRVIRQCPDHFDPLAVRRGRG